MGKRRLTRKKVVGRAKWELRLKQVELATGTARFFEIVIAYMHYTEVILELIEVLIEIVFIHIGFGLLRKITIKVMVTITLP